jgi:hypothetical protein
MLCASGKILQWGELGGAGRVFRARGADED